MHTNVVISDPAHGWTPTLLSHQQPWCWIKVWVLIGKCIACDFIIMHANNQFSDELLLGLSLNTKFANLHVSFLSSLPEKEHQSFNFGSVWLKSGFRNYCNFQHPSKQIISESQTCIQMEFILLIQTVKKPLHVITWLFHDESALTLALTLLTVHMPNHTANMDLSSTDCISSRFRPLTFLVQSPECTYTSTVDFSSINSEAFI